ncbi:MAG: DUF488 family protein [Salinisphaeraceae bacterium]|nr:DUF488 family protein [Salinisphaeraceae bacterium]
MPSIVCKRIYDEPAADDGYRVLIDRLWPRGISKANAAINTWARELAPSDQLRKDFNHEPERWDAFVRDYSAELAGQGAALQALLDAAQGQRITLVYAARDTEHNNAVAFAQILQHFCSKKP